MRLFKKRDSGADYDAVQKLAQPLRVKDFLYGVNISLRYKYLYCETPKVASSTIKRTLQDLELGQLGRDQEDERRLYDRTRSPLLNPLQVPDFRRLLDDDAFFKFCFVRNPYARILSAFLDKFVTDLASRRRALKKYRMRGHFWKRDVGFGDFVRMVSRQRPQDMDLHWRPQVLQTFHPAIRYDFVGKLENFRADFGSVLTRLGADPGSFETIRIYATNAASLMGEHYDQSLADAVYSIYRDDFVAFGYDRQMPSSA